MPGSITDQAWLTHCYNYKKMYKNHSYFSTQTCRALHVSEKLPTYPSSKPTLTLISQENLAIPFVIKIKVRHRFFKHWMALFINPTNQYPEDKNLEANIASSYA